MSCSQHRYHRTGCEPCKKGARDYFHMRRAAIAAGAWERPVPVAEVRRHLRKLRRQRMTIAEIADTARVGRSTVTHILSPKRGRKTVMPDISRQILAVPLPIKPRPPRVDWVPSVAASRMVRALCTDGWSINEQSRDSGVAYSVVRLLAVDTPPEHISRKNDGRIADLYRRRAGVRNPRPYVGARTRNAAIAKGWHPWHAWDDDTIADPKATPRLDAARPRKSDYEPANIHAALAGGSTHDELTLAERLEVVAILLARGWHDGKIGAWLRWGDDTGRQFANVCKFRRDHGLTVGSARRGTPTTAPTADDEQPELELAA